MKLTKRETIMLVAGFIIVAVAAYAFYFIIPQMNRQQAVMTQLNASRSTLQTLTVKNTSLDRLKKQITTQTEELRQKTTNVPRGSDDTRILLYLNGLARKTGNNIDIRFNDKPTAEGSFLYRVVALDCVTSYDKLSSLLEELNREEMYNIVQVVTAEYQAPKATASAQESTAPEATPPPAPQVTGNTLYAHIEIYFYAFQPQPGDAASEPALTPNPADRRNSLFPK